VLPTNAASSSTKVQVLVNGNAITDPDNAAPPAAATDNLGIAITFAKVVGGGHWEYKLDNGPYTTFTATQTAAVLLPGRAFIRYVPEAGADATVGGQAYISYRGWSFPAGALQGVGTADLSDTDPATPGNQAAGGSTHFTTGFSKATLNILAAPKLTLGAGAASPVGVAVSAGVNFMYGSGSARSAVSDVDTTSFANGVLAVTGLLAGDKVGVNGAFKITGTDLTYNGTSIGTVDAGLNGVGTDLKITLNGSVNADIASRLVNALRFSSSTAGSRTLNVRISDGSPEGSQFSTAVTRVINVT